MGATTSVLAPKQQQANKSKASKTKRLKKCKKSSGGIRAEVRGAPAGSAAMSPRSAPQTRGSGCCVSRWGRSAEEKEEETGLQTGSPGDPALHHTGQRHLIQALGGSLPQTHSCHLRMKATGLLSSPCAFYNPCPHHSHKSEDTMPPTSSFRECCPLLSCAPQSDGISSRQGPH